MIKKLLLVLALLLLPGVAEATTRYISPTGSNSNSCAASTSSSTPKQTFEGGSGAIACMAGGDTLIMLSGTFTTFLLDTANSIPNGSVGAPTRIVVESGATVTATGAGVGDVSVIQFNNGAGKSYITIDGGTNCGANTGGAACNLILDGTGSAASALVNIGTTNNNIILTNFELKSTVNNGVGFGGNFNVLSNCNIHHNGGSGGPSSAYGVYQGNGTDTMIENCAVHHNGGFGIHVNADSNADQGLSNSPDHLVQRATFRFNDIYANGQYATIEVAGLLLGGFSEDVDAYGNLVHDNVGTSNGIMTNFFRTTRRPKIYNNTITRNARAGIQLDGSTTAVVRNNIAVNNNLSNTSRGNIETGTATGQTLSNNLTFGTGGTTNGNFTTDPLFVDANNANFRVNAGSPAIDNGTTTGNPAGNTADIVGTTRPQGTLFDLGAYERASAATCPSLPNALVAQYRFEGVSTDSSGNGLTATLGTGWSYTTGKYGQGVTTTGASGITVADNDLLDLCASFALELWVNVPSSSSDVMFIVKNPSSKYFLGMLANFCDPSTSLLGGYSQGAAVGACSAPDLTAGTFYHLAVSYDGTTVSLYRNASLVTTAAGGAVLDATTGTLQFCTSGFGETCPAGTIIDEVKIYRGPRTGAQIMADMLDGSTPTNVVLKIPSGATGLKLGGSGVKLGTQSQ